MTTADNESPTDDEVFLRAQAMFGTGCACWPNCRPSRVAAEARMAYEAGSLCRLDFYAVTTMMTLLVATAPPEYRNEWPPKTPAEIANVGLMLVRGDCWSKYVSHVRKNDPLPVR